MSPKIKPNRRKKKQPLKFQLDTSWELIEQKVKASDEQGVIKKFHIKH
jgi:hypothetical protein